MSLVLTERLPALLRGDYSRLTFWFGARNWNHPKVCLLAIALGAGSYGAAIGIWRSPVQATYTALKLPLILLLTAGGNALLNCLLAPLLGAALRVRQTLLAILSSFAIASVILGSFAPLVFFQVWTSPAAVTIDTLSRGASSRSLSVGTFSLLQLSHVLIVAFAGIAANLRLYRWLAHFTADADVARRLLLGWLGGNFLLGTQVTWIFRPFFGTPTLPVEFLRPHPMQGSFFETIWSGLISHF